MLHDGVEPDLVWGRALEWRRVASASSHETRFSSLAPADQAVMRLAATGVVLFGHDVELLSLSRSSAQLGRKRLVERAQITETDRGVKVVDPLHAD